MTATLGDMPLYTHLDRIERGLAAQGIGPGEPVRPEQLFALDQWHYHGTEAIAAAARTLGLGPKSRVLDVGAGVGGPARFLAHTIGCHVTALELQPALHEIGVDLTRRSGLASRVTHLCGDAVVEPLPEAGFDAVVSFLAIVHIPERPRLFRRLVHALQSGGGCYIEDLCMRQPFAPRDLDDLRRIVCANSITRIDDYAADLRGAGFTDVVASDLTPDWAAYATERLAAWRANRAAYAAVHGDGAWQAQDLFYSVIARFYDSGSLGGVRLVVRLA
jgi:cyclopropane fatty-acyl-phospholipid synthase-like methyltransferase